MRKIRKHGFSLKWGLVAVMAVCWILPISVTLFYSGHTITSNMQERIRNTITTSVGIAFEQAKENVADAMNASKKASYDETIWAAYRKYGADHDGVALYDAVNAYLLRQYGSDKNFNATFLFFTDSQDEIYYVNSRRDSRELDSLKKYRHYVHDEALNAHKAWDTGIVFMEREGALYMMRAIMDNSFRPYAVLVMECNEAALFESISAIVWLERAVFYIGDTASVIVDTGAAEDDKATDDTLNGGENSMMVKESAMLFEHALSLSVLSDTTALTKSLPDVLNLLPLLGVFGVLLFLFALWAYYHYVSYPVAALVDAAEHVERGERGYIVSAQPHSREFRYLTERFNSMSEQLKYQFERSIEEQLALQDARVNALRSQINPHFLNNTLEAISWTARMSGDAKVCRMIEALSTMLDAATARGGRAYGTMEQELAYADAYLYILSERVGDRLRIRKDIAPNTLHALVPCLILQPIVENAFEHGSAMQERVEIIIKSMLLEGALIIEVLNSGYLSEAQCDKIARLLDPFSEEMKEKNGCVGIRNVNRRLKILYGEQGDLSISQLSGNWVLARIVIPNVEFSE